MDELAFQSAASLAKLIRDRQASSQEVVDACLLRIEQVNPVINAVVLLTADAARAAARAADDAMASGRVLGPLHGVPMTIKDAVETEGVISTGGTKGRASYVPDRDATVVARLRQAGAILLGKTNLPELSLAGESDNLVYGRTNNPYDPSRIAGGSSGGEAAIIAAGGSPFGIGSDVGGSVRHPAHCCGIAGINPTSGRVPRTGHFPSADGIQEPMWQLGPLARRVEDLALLLPVIAGPDGIDPGIVQMPLGNPGEVDLAGLRVSFHTAVAELKPTAETSATVTNAAAALAEAGAVVEEATPEPLKDKPFGVSGADGGAGLRKILEEAGTTEIHPLTERSLSLQADRVASSAELMELLIRKDELRRRMLSFLQSYDVIVCPAHTHPAVPHGTTYDEEHLPGFRYTGFYNLTGWPGAVVRGGTSADGLPIGVQVVAAPWREDVALAVAQRIEDALGGWQPPPL